MTSEEWVRMKIYKRLMTTIYKHRMYRTGRDNIIYRKVLFINNNGWWESY